MKFRTKVLISTILVLTLVGGLYIWQGEALFNPKTNNEAGSSAKEAEQPSPVDRDGAVIDTGDQEETGDENEQTTETAWISSDSGEISLIQPTANAVLRSGSTIKGTATVNNVSYRLIDDHVGVIATGNLGVIDGKFSGEFDFSSNGTEGRLDIFSTLENGAEVNVIEVPVRFK